MSVVVWTQIFPALRQLYKGKRRSLKHTLVTRFTHLSYQQLLQLSEIDVNNELFFHTGGNMGCPTQLVPTQQGIEEILVRKHQRTYKKVNAK